jgi:hypothetical protein
MAGLALQAGASLQSIAASATSVRLHAAPPSSYANAVSTSLGIRSFVAGTFFTFAGGQLSVPTFSGSVTAAGTAAFFSICNDTAPALLAVAPLPAPTVLTATQNNWLLSITLLEAIGSPTFSSP